MEAAEVPSSGLRRVPDGYRISKRPLIRPAIPSPYNSARQPKCVYVSARSPFISTVKRVRKLQNEIVKRSLDKTSIIDGDNDSRAPARSDKQKLQQISAKDRNPEPVFIKGTGKAIEKVMSLGLYFQGQEDCRIELKTFTATAVDNIERVEGKTTGEGMVDEKETTSENPSEPVDETQARGLSGLEVAVYLR